MTRDGFTILAMRRPARQHLRDVAEMFGKRHADVLRDIRGLELNADLRSPLGWFRDIDALIHSPNMGDGWFREVRTEHPTPDPRYRARHCQPSRDWCRSRHSCRTAASAGRISAS